MSATQVLVVSGEPVWPPIHGGRKRTAGLAAALGRQLDVCVLAARSEEPPPTELEHEELPDEQRPSKLAAFASTEPAVGRQLLGASRREAVVAAVRRRGPGAVLFAHSYIAAMVPPLGKKVVVDFADVDVRRTASLAQRGRLRKRLVWRWESLKARRWEPPVARAAALAVACTPEDAAIVSSWGARAVYVPHGADRIRSAPSPATGPVTFVGNMGYGPNLDGVRFLIERVWPLVRAHEPAIRLRLVGWHAERSLHGLGDRGGVELVSNVPDVGPFYAEASLMVSPVREGGGAQLKIVEGLASGRIFVVTPFSGRSAPRGAGDAVVVAADADRFAELVLRLWRNVGERRARERVLEGAVVPTWEEAARPLVAELKRILASE